MQFMVLSERRSKEFEESDCERVLPDEMDRARQLCADGVFRQIWSGDDCIESCFLIEAPDTQRAVAIVDGLPFARAGSRGFHGDGPLPVSRLRSRLSSDRAEAGLPPKFPGATAAMNERDTSRAGCERTAA
jgi:hypothetical protein